MPEDNILKKVKKLRDITGVGFKDCKTAIDENNGDIDKSIEYLRKKGIAKASKRMERVAAEGLVCISEKENNFSILEVNSETDFVAKNSEFIKFVEDVSELSLISLGNIKKLLSTNMKNNKTVTDNLVALTSKIGEKITIRRCDFISSEKNINFSYTHAPIKNNIGKIGVLLSLSTKKKKRKFIRIWKTFNNAHSRDISTSYW